MLSGVFDVPLIWRRCLPWARPGGLLYLPLELWAVCLLLQVTGEEVPWGSGYEVGKAA